MSLDTFRTFPIWCIGSGCLSQCGCSSKTYFLEYRSRSFLPRGIFSVGSNLWFWCLCPLNTLPYSHSRCRKFKCPCRGPSVTDSPHFYCFRIVIFNLIMSRINYTLSCWLFSKGLTTLPKLLLKILYQTYFLF